jgi:2-C-methyl-D-erythritol 4-phosphate cytidylyltransferase
METTETKIEHRLMTIEEQAKVMYEAVLLYDEGKDEEALQLVKSVPLTPALAKNVKEVYGADYLANSGFNLLEADEKYGKDWLYK